MNTRFIEEVVAVEEKFRPPAVYESIEAERGRKCLRCKAIHSGYYNRDSTGVWKVLRMQFRRND
jgi:hypothetical protein